MRRLVIIAHYFRPEGFANWHSGLGSGRSPFAKIVALNEQIVAFHRYHGPRAISRHGGRPLHSDTHGTLDIVVMTVRGANLLEWIGIDPATYAVEYFDGAPQMLPFEAQRIMRERSGAYDLYGYFEDDLIIDDPAFFDKTAWFAQAFGPDALLLPIRYELAHAGVPAKVAIEVPLSRQARAPFRRAVPASLRGSWNGREQTFRLPQNPHSGCFCVTQAQLTKWMQRPSFYDRDASWIDPMVSASTFAPGKVFALYRGAEPDPWFLQIQHYGTRYSATVAGPGESFGEAPLLALVEAAARSGFLPLPKALEIMATDHGSINKLIAEAEALRHELRSLKKSRSKLLKALAAALWSKLRGRD